MQLTNAPGKLVLPFANAGGKNTIPVASQIGIVAGAASLTDGFPPLTRTPLAAGGTPPSGLDMNGILYELSAILRWANAGGGYVYDSTFANDSNVGGYPKGARVLRSDGLGYWFNTTDNNTTDPEANTVAAIAAGWVPDFTNGVATVTMTNANVTLTPLQYGKPIVIISGLLTANLNLIFPTGMVGEWTVINNTTGAYSVTCKTAAGTGVVVNTAQLIVGDGTNIYNGNLDSVSLLSANVGSAGGTADALTVTFGATIRSWAQIAGIPFWLRAASANATTTPTLAANGLAAKTYVKGAGSALVAGVIAGAGHWLLQQYDATLDKVVLLNPATGVTASATADNGIQDFRLTLTSGTPVTNADVTGATTIYCTPYKGNRISLYNGSAWNTRTSAEFSLALGTLTSGLPYDVFCYDNAGTPTLEFLAWTNGTARATALVYQDGVLSKSGATTRRYLGTFYTTATTTTEDSATKRYLWNYYNRVKRALSRQELTASWTYTTATWRQANNAAANQVELVCGVSEDALDIDVHGIAANSSAGGFATGVGVDSTTVNSAQRGGYNSGVATGPLSIISVYKAVPAVGRHYYAWLEMSQATGTTTFYGNSTVASVPVLSAIQGDWQA